MELLLWRQIWVLTLKNLSITLGRHWISTPLRALVLPILIVLLLSFTENFVSPDGEYGVGSSRPIRSLSDVERSATGGRDRVIFVNNGFSNGDIDAIIGNVTLPLRESGINVQTLERETELRTACLSTIRGVSHCIAAAIFYSSPTEGNGSIWNYTIRADGSLGESPYVFSDSNDAQVYTLPLQHAIDFAIGNYTTHNSTASSQAIYEYPFTSRSQEEFKYDNRVTFINMISSILATPFYIAIACIIYHLTGFIANEREIGMTQLLDTMMPNRYRWQPRVARIVAHHLSFDILYATGWIVTGAIMGTMCFPKTTIIIPILFNIFAGLSTTSFAIFAGGFFKKAQLSGIIAIIASLLFAIIAQITYEAGTTVIVTLSLLLPPMNYIYFLVLLTNWERENRPLNLFKSAPTSFTVPAIVFFIFAIWHTFVYAILAAIIESKLYGTSSTLRSTVISQSPVAVNLNGFTKEYAPGWIARALRFWNKLPMESVLAVDDLNLQAYRGEILVLLGANGSGKSTTLDAVAGLHSITSGEILINYLDPCDGFGYCPQKNILWDELSVAEHVKIFDGIKSRGKMASTAEIADLIESCDLTKKRKGLSKSLSGGQKRKLQMAMMFAGNSSVCCIDEVSSGVDPLSRRKLWDILLAKRGSRSIILTTHFLDEADLLADRIAILSKGRLRASGPSVELKNRLGSGYRVHVHEVPGSTKTPLYTDVLHTDQPYEAVYFPGSSADTYRFLARLERDGVINYEVKGPTLEDVFFKIEEDALSKQTKRSSFESITPLVSDAQEKPGNLQRLRSGKPGGILKQIGILIAKRFTILRRNPGPYMALLLIPIIAAGCSTIFLDSYQPGSCNPEDQAGRSGIGQSAAEYKLVAGPKAQLSAAALETIAKAPPGAVTMVDTFEQFNVAVQQRYGELVPGGFFLGDKPTIAWRANGPPLFAHINQNMISSLLFNITIQSNYGFLDVPFGGSLTGPLLFLVLFGLSMAIYPAFLALYPTMERLRGVRSMHYSNGVRIFSLWLSYLLFDFCFVVFTSLAAVIIFGATSDDVYYSMEYVLLILLLYGITSSLYSYVVALFSASQLAAFAITAGTQVACFLVYFLVSMVVFTSTEPSKQTSTLNIAYFTLGIVSPSVNLSRSLYLALNVFGIACRNRRIAPYPGAIDLYGGPILYLILQALILFGVLVWKESGSTLRLCFRRYKIRARRSNEAEVTDAIQMEAPSEVAGTTRSSDGLRVLNLRKKFRKHLAVDDVTFGIPRNECFALCGPNGAGKSTSISMICGDLQPTSHTSEIFIDGISAIRHPGRARAKLGVCPQIDPLDSMTVSEHLRFYAKIRGINEPEHVDAIVKAVGLERFVDRLATKLSGGNKRKLSLGIALVGNPSVLLLDEPSSGMDAVSKRVMWRTLSSIIPGRSLLLTTHSMEEADALASRAGIIAGRMLALGTTEDLRRQYGSVYYIHLVHAKAPHTSASDMRQIEEWVEREFPEAKMDAWMGYGQVKFEAPVRGADGRLRSLAGVFGKLENGKNEIGVVSYGVGTATLDQIFLSVVGRYYSSEEEGS